MNAVWEGSWQRQDCQEQLQEDGGRRRVSLSEEVPPRQCASDSPAHSFVLLTFTDSLPRTCWGPRDSQHIPRDTWEGKGPGGSQQ